MKRRTRKPLPKQHKPLLVRFPAKQHRELKEYADDVDDSMNNVVLLAVERHIRQGKPLLSVVPDPEEAA